MSEPPSSRKVRASVVVQHFVKTRLSAIGEVWGLVGAKSQNQPQRSARGHIGAPQIKGGLQVSVIERHIVPKRAGI
jgi:hypothetical protein